MGRVEGALLVLRKRAQRDDCQSCRPGARGCRVVQTPAAVGILVFGQPNGAAQDSIFGKRGINGFQRG